MTPLAATALPWRWIGLAIAVMAVFAGGCYVGDRWSDGAHQRAMAAEHARYEQLAAGVREQNRAIDDLAARGGAARAAAEVAERLAKERRTIIERQVRTVTEYVPTSCDDALQHWWSTK